MTDTIERELEEGPLKCAFDRRECRSSGPRMDSTFTMWHGHRCPGRFARAVAAWVREREAGLRAEVEKLRAVERHARQLYSITESCPQCLNDTSVDGMLEALAALDAAKEKPTP